MRAEVSNKYWKVHSQRNNAYYAVALTRALIPCEGDFKAKSTVSEVVIVSPRAARFCRGGESTCCKEEKRRLLYI